MSSRPEKKKACSGPPKTKTRPYDNRPRPGQAPAKQRASRTTDAIRVDLPADPPTFTPEAAWALLRILLKARDQPSPTDPAQGGEDE